MQVLRINIKNGYTGGLDINDIALLEVNLYNFNCFLKYSFNFLYAHQLTQSIKLDDSTAKVIYYGEENENIPTAVISGWGARGVRHYYRL